MINTNQNNGSNSFDDFFDKLASFDTETTGIDTKKDRIWQAGFTKKGIDTEEVVNPFFRFDEVKKAFEPEDLSIIDFHERMRESNGAFSRQAYANNNFAELFYRHHVTKDLSNSLSDTLEKTLGNISRGDILVLQNHNFENKLIQRGYEDGLISKTTYQRLQDKMEFLHVDHKGSTLGLLQVPTEVSDAAQRASFLYNTQYLDNIRDQRRTFTRYKNAMNDVMDAYKSAMSRVDRGAIVIEQMDVTKALYANAIDLGYMDRNHATIGLNIEFLNDALFDGKVEAHTALSDSKDTIDVFKKTWTMLEELRTGTVSEATRDILVSLNEKQYGEAHKQFLKSVDGVLNDINRQGYTKFSRRGSFYAPQRRIYDASTGNISIIDGASVGRNDANKGRISALDTALANIESRYSDHGNASLRAEHIDNIKEAYRQGGIQKAILLSEDMKSKFRTEDLPIAKGVSTDASWWKEKTTLLGKEVNRGTKTGLIVGGLLTLGYMAMKDSPEKRSENSYVSQQFYDEQYLGTQFVNFNERNKHYMY